VSEASPLIGEGSERHSGRRSRGVTEDRNVTVEFEHGRWGHGGWALFGLVVGSLLLWHLGIVGKGLGAVLVGFGVYHGVAFARTLLHPAGEIRVTDTEVRLPRGLCRSGALAVAPEAIRHAYFLRRSVPWSKAGPVLVVETEGQTHLFPRDWFASDADQRRVAHALNRRLDRLP
jgi:hypothetical protein